MIGSDVAIVAEIAAAEIEGGRFKQGANVEILLTPKDGQPVTLTGSSGDYLIEVTAKAGDKTDTQVLAIRVSMAR